MKEKKEHFHHTIKNKSLGFIDKSLSYLNAFILINKLKENNGLIKYIININISINGQMIKEINQNIDKDGNLIISKLKYSINEEYNKKLLNMLDNLYEDSKINNDFLEEIIKIVLKDKVVEIILTDMCLNNNKSLLIEEFKNNKLKKITNDSYIKKEFSNINIESSILKVIKETKNISENLFELVRKEDLSIVLNLINIKLEEEKNKELLLKLFKNIEINNQNVEYSNEVLEKYIEYLLNEEIKCDLNIIKNLYYKLAGKNLINLKKIFIKKYPPKKVMKVYKSELKNEEYKNITFLLSMIENLEDEVIYLKEIMEKEKIEFLSEKINNRLINLDINEIVYILNICKEKKKPLYLSVNNIRNILSVLNNYICLDIKKELVNLIENDNYYQKTIPEIKLVNEQYELRENLRYF